MLQHPFVRRHLSLAAILRALRQPVLLTGLLATVCLWGFAEIADAVGEKETQRFDERILKSLRDPGDPDSVVGPPWVEQSLRDITALGGETVLTLITVIVCFYLSLAGRRDLSLFAAGSVIGGAVLMFILKDLFARPRPELVPHILVSVSSGSFPSGHAMSSAVVYLTLGAMLTESVTTWRLKIYVMSVAITLTLLIGSTRVFLGVHYPTDVIAGWALGFVWAYFCGTAVRLIRFFVTYRRLDRTGARSSAETSVPRAAS
jgi:undecaprenyl-diphosphatase